MIFPKTLSRILKFDSNVIRINGFVVDYDLSFEGEEFKRK
jgi:hypothetical protein